MHTARTALTLLLMAGLIGGAYWISRPSGKPEVVASTQLPKPPKCRPHESCHKSATRAPATIEASASP